MIIMKKLNITPIKRTYFAPIIELIKLDNEISLILESDPPYPENENISDSREYFNKNNPLKVS